MTEDKENEIYLHIDFNGKFDETFIYKENIHFKIVDLQKKNPLLQIGQYVFQGTYEDCLGTNVYFEEVEDARNINDPFVRPSPVCLQYVAKANKILKMKLQKLPDKSLNIPENETLELDFTKNYKAVIKKLKNCSLKIDDAVKKEIPEDPLINSNIDPDLCPNAETLGTNVTSENNEDVKLTLETVTDNMEVKPENDTNRQEMLNNKYELLKKIAKHPLRTKKFKEKINEINFDDASENSYLVLKQLFLQNLPYKDIPLKIKEDKLHFYVDIDNSIRNNIITKRTLQNLSELERNRLISIENFDNLCIPLQLTILSEQLKIEKAELLKMTEEQLEVIDEHGRTPKDRYRILKRLTKDIWYHMYFRFRNNQLEGFKNYNVDEDEFTSDESIIDS